jgi:hypothetical protein
MKIQPWWNKKWGNDKLCAITYSRVRPGSNKNGVPYTTKLKCGHYFYTNALLEWVKQCGNSISTCPNCRQPFDILEHFK